MFDNLPVPVYTDLQTLARLRAMANKDNSPQTWRAVATQFEAQFVQMMLKSMRDAGLGEGLFENDHTRLYRDLFDQQLALNLSQSKGIGLADIIIKQLGGNAAAGQPSSSRTPAETLLGSSSASEPRFSAPHGASYATGDLKPPSLSLPAASMPLHRFAIPGAPHSSRSFPTNQGPEGAPGLLQKAAQVCLQTDAKRSWEARGEGLGRDPTLRSEEATPAEFIRRLWPHAQQAAQSLGIHPGVLLAQAALETGWGRKIPRHPNGRSSYNLFGIKADTDWQGDRLALPTLEYVQGLTMRSWAAFRSYRSFAESFADYVNLLRSSPRYARALQFVDAPEDFICALQEAGYATDPSYARKIIEILKGETLRQALVDLKLGDEWPMT